MSTIATVAITFFSILAAGFLFLIIIQLSAIVEQFKMFNKNTVVVYEQHERLNENVKKIADNTEPVAEMAEKVSKRIDYYA